MSATLTPPIVKPRRKKLREREFTVDGFEQFSGARGFELVSGLLLEKPVGTQAARIGGTLFNALSLHVHQRRLGWVFSAEMGYRCFPESEKKVRKPDVSYISFSRMPPASEPLGYCPFAPEIVAEVISPHDVYDDLLDRLIDFMAAGTALAWLIHPRKKRVMVYRNQKLVGEISGDGILTGDDVLPDFAISLPILFAIPGLPQPA